MKIPPSSPNRTNQLPGTPAILWIRLRTINLPPHDPTAPEIFSSLSTTRTKKIIVFMYKNLQRLLSFLSVSSGFVFFLINQIVVFSLTWIEVFDYSLFVLATAMSQRAANEISMASFPRSQVPKTMNDHTSIHLYIHTYIYIYIWIHLVM